MTTARDEKLEIEHRLDDRRRQYAKVLQVMGLTFTEIAERMNVRREDVVQTLYWDVVK